MVKTRSLCQHTALKGKVYEKDISHPSKKRPLPSHKRKKSLCPSLGRLPYTFIYWEYAFIFPWLKISLEKIKRLEFAIFQERKTQLPLLSCHDLHEIMPLSFVQLRTELIVNHGTKAVNLKVKGKDKKWNYTEWICIMVNVFFDFAGRNHVISYWWCLFFSDL